MSLEKRLFIKTFEKVYLHRKNAKCPQKRKIFFFHVFFAPLRDFAPLRCKRRVFQNYLIFILIFFLLPGCAGLQRKFVRKPKEKEKPTPVVQTIDYSVGLRSEELYKKHFLFWQSWHTELIDRIGDNFKKRTVCYDQIMTSLKSMRKYLIEEKARELDPFIVQIESIGKDTKKERLSATEVYRIKTVLEKTKRQIDKRFSYRDVKNYLK